MSRKKIVAGNWKMNKTLQEAEALVKEVLSSETPGDVVKIFFPPFPYINSVSNLIYDYQNGFHCGAQNCHYNDSGAFTGEVSAKAAASVGARYVLIGHSERRIMHKEGPEFLKLKISRCLENNLVPVYCIGEMLPGREANKHFGIVERQLEEVMFNFSVDDVRKIVVAYEPVWAIGTGKTASPEEAGEMHSFIRNRIAHHYNEEIANAISILYGGSCNAQNAKALFATKDIDGGLIGGASLQASDFVSIINSF
ncbi:MAG: triose-phosphate isomerase [Bacteroidota bacterium]|nr:triose-phosphate isomerase [Bacteroidota bacterium]